MGEQEYKIHARVKRHMYTADVTACDDPRLSYSALGVFTYIMRQYSWKDDWNANEKDITNRHSDGKCAVRSAIKELIRFGYVNRVQVRSGGRIVDWRLDFYASPEDNPDYKPNEIGRETRYTVENQDEQLDSSALDSSDQDLECRNTQGNNNIRSSNLIDLELEDQQTHAPACVQPEPPKPTLTPPAKTTEPPMGERSGFHGLLGQKPASWYGLRSQQREAMQRQEAARQAGLTSITEVTEALIRAHALSAVIEAGDDRALRRMQDMAITLGTAPLLVRTVAQVEALFEDWKATHRGKTVPYGSVLLEYASRLMAEGRLKDGNTVAGPAATPKGSGKRTGVKGGDASVPDGEWTERARQGQAAFAAAHADMPELQSGDIPF